MSYSNISLPFWDQQSILEFEFELNLHNIGPRTQLAKKTQIGLFCSWGTSLPILTDQWRLKQPPESTNTQGRT